MATASNGNNINGGGGDGHAAGRVGCARHPHEKAPVTIGRPAPSARACGRMLAPCRTTTTRCRLCVGPGRGLPGNTGGYPTGRTPRARVVVTSTPTSVSRSVPMYGCWSETKPG